MRVFWSIICGMVLMVGVVYLAQAQQEAETEGGMPEPSSLKTDSDRQCYFFGASIARKFINEGLNINESAMVMGIRDVISGGPMQLTPQQMQQENTKYNEHLRQRMIALTKQNKEESEIFLAENKTLEGVTTLPSGVQYMVMNEGSGPKPILTDVVKIHNRIMLLNGRLIENSYQRPEPPPDILINNIRIPGLQEVLQLMPVGSKWRLWLPTDQGYPRGGPPNAVIVFEVELLEIVPAASN